MAFENVQVFEISLVIGKLFFQNKAADTEVGCSLKPTLCLDFPCVICLTQFFLEKLMDYENFDRFFSEILSLFSKTTS